MEQSRKQFHREVSALQESFGNKLKLRNVVEARFHVERRVQDLLNDMESIVPADFAQLRVVALQQECIAEELSDTGRTPATGRLAARHVSFIKRQIRLLQRRLHSRND